MSQWLNLNRPNRHPLTGELIQPVGFVGGRVIWPSMGGSDEDDKGTDNNSNAGGEGQQGNENDDQGSSGDNQGSQSGSETVSKADFDQIMARMQAADRRATKAENELKELRDASKSEQQRKEDEHATAVKEAQALKERLRKASIGNAFLTVKGFNWHDPSDALDMLMARYLDGVQVDDDGKVSGVEAAVKKMAKDKSYLIRSEDSGSSANDQMNGKRKGQQNEGDQKTKDEALARRFPALQRGRAPQ